MAAILDLIPVYFGICFLFGVACLDFTGCKSKISGSFGMVFDFFGFVDKGIAWGGGKSFPDMIFSVAGEVGIIIIYLHFSEVRFLIDANFFGFHFGFHFRNPH